MGSSCISSKVVTGASEIQVNLKWKTKASTRRPLISNQRETWSPDDHTREHAQILIYASSRIRSSCRCFAVRPTTAVLARPRLESMMAASAERRLRARSGVIGAGCPCFAVRVPPSTRPLIPATRQALQGGCRRSRYVQKGINRQRSRHSQGSLAWSARTRKSSTSGSKEAGLIRKTPGEC
jgi:hypothetical protein